MLDAAACSAYVRMYTEGFDDFETLIVHAEFAMGKRYYDIRYQHVKIHVHVHVHVLFPDANGGIIGKIELN
jgi:hypothetical protein